MFFRTHMPQALQGADIYDVESRWDPGPGMSFANTGESLRNIAAPSLSSRNISRAQIAEQRTGGFITYSAAVQNKRNSNR
jgi:hypothetical protein